MSLRRTGSLRESKTEDLRTWQSPGLTSYTLHTHLPIFSHCFTMCRQLFMPSSSIPLSPFSINLHDPHYAHPQLSCTHAYYLSSSPCSCPHCSCSPYPKITHILQYPSFIFLHTHIIPMSPSITSSYLYHSFPLHPTHACGYGYSPYFPHP